MYHLEAVVVKRWSEKAESPPSILPRTSCDIDTEFMRKRSSDLIRHDIACEHMI